MRKLRGLATGAGSFPHTDADAALDLIFKYTPQIPFWPQLPKRDKREGMVEQFSENFFFLNFTSGELRKNYPVYDENREKEFCDHIIKNDIDYFKINEDFAKGLYSCLNKLETIDLKDIEFIKLQVTGPFTFAASIGGSIFRNRVFMSAILEGLAMKARWQIKQFHKFGKKMIIFFDEPYLGCFGSAYTPINRDEVISNLSEFTSLVKKSDPVLLGVHCCGNTDWSIFTDVPGIDIINFDAFSFLDKFVLYADALKGFLARGGIICWGIVPTQDYNIGNGSGRQLVDRLMQGVEALVKKGIPKELILENLLISPSCGLGTLSPQKSEQILKLLADTAVLI